MAVDSKAYWMGKDVATLSHQEAIEALKYLVHERESLLENFEKIREIDQMIADLPRQSAAEAGRRLDIAKQRWWKW